MRAQGGCCDWAPFVHSLVTVDAVLLNSGGAAVVSTLLQLPRLRELRCRVVPESLVGLRLQVHLLIFEHRHGLNAKSNY